MFGFDPVQFDIERVWSKSLKSTLLIIFYLSAYSACSRTWTKLSWLQISSIEKARIDFRIFYCIACLRREAQIVKFIYHFAGFIYSFLPTQLQAQRSNPTTLDIHSFATDFTDGIISGMKTKFLVVAFFLVILKPFQKISIKIIMRIYKNGFPNSNPNYQKNALKKMKGKISRPGFVMACSGLAAWFGTTMSELWQQLLHFISLSVCSCAWQGEIPRVMDMNSPAAKLSYGNLYFAFPAHSSQHLQWDRMSTQIFVLFKSSLCLAWLLEVTTGQATVTQGNSHSTSQHLGGEFPDITMEWWE